jgi:hypothetical protein
MMPYIHFDENLLYLDKIDEEVMFI